MSCAWLILSFKNRLYQNSTNFQKPYPWSIFNVEQSILLYNKAYYWTLYCLILRSAVYIVQYCFKKKKKKKNEKKKNEKKKKKKRKKEGNLCILFDRISFLIRPPWGIKTTKFNHKKNPCLTVQSSRVKKLIMAQKHICTMALYASVCLSVCLSAFVEPTLCTISTAQSYDLTRQ